MTGEAQQPTQKMVDKMLNNKKENESSGSSKPSNIFLIRLGKDLFIISFPHAILLYEFLKWLFLYSDKNKELNQQVNIIKSTSTNDNHIEESSRGQGEITMRSVEPGEIPDGTIVLEEVDPEAQRILNSNFPNALNSNFNPNAWVPNMAHNCANEEPPVIPPTNRPIIRTR